MFKGPVPPNVDAVAAAVGRRSDGPILKDNLSAAYALGLTTAVPSRPAYLAARTVKDIPASRQEGSFRTDRRDADALGE